jgi:hypothetical protein
VVNIAEAASVATLTASAAVEVKGTGKIETANIKAENVKIEQKPDKVNVDEGITAEVGGETVEGGTTPTTPPSGGGVPQSVSATAISLKISGGSEIAGTVTGNTAYFDLSDKNTYPDNLMIVGMKIVCNPSDCTLTITSVDSVNGWDSEEQRDIANLSNITVPQLTGTTIFGNDISLGSLRILFGSSVTVNGTLKRSGYTSKDLTLTINLGEYPEELNTQLLNIEMLSSKEANATIADPDLLDEYVSGRGISNLLLSLLGSDDMPKHVRVDKDVTGVWIDVTSAEGKVNAANAIASAANTTWQEMKFADLIGLTILASRDDVPDESNAYIVHIIN